MCPYFGSTHFRIEGKDWFDRAGQQAIYLPGQSCSVETSHFNGLLFNLNPQRLATTISEVSRHRMPLELLHGIGSGHPGSPLALGVKHWSTAPAPA